MLSFPSTQLRIGGFDLTRGFTLRLSRQYGNGGPGVGEFCEYCSSIISLYTMLKVYNPLPFDYASTMGFVCSAYVSQDVVARLALRVYGFTELCAR